MVAQAPPRPLLTAQQRPPLIVSEAPPSPAQTSPPCQAANIPSSLSGRNMCSPLMKCVTCTLVILAAFILTMLVVVKITGGPSDRAPPPPSTQPPLPRVGKGGSFDNHPRDPVTHETLFGLINFFQNRQEGDKDSVNTGHHQVFSLMVIIFLVSLLIGLLVLVICCLKGKCSKLLTLAPMRHNSSGGLPSSHLPLAVLPPTISAPHQLIPPERHLEQPQLQRHCSSPAFLQDSWRHRFESGAQGGGEAGRQHPSLVADRLLRSPVTQGCSGLEAQPGVLAPKSWYEPRAPALELDADYQQPAFSPPPTYPHPPGCLQATKIGVIEAAVKAGHTTLDTYPLATTRDSKSGERGEHALAIFLPLLC